MLIKQVYVLEHKKGWFFEDECEVYGEEVLTKKVIKVTKNIFKANQYYDFESAQEYATSIGFKVLSMNTYLEEVQ